MLNSEIMKTFLIVALSLAMTNFSPIDSNYVDWDIQNDDVTTCEPCNIWLI